MSPAVKHRGPGISGKHIWTPAEDAELIASYERGEFSHEIAGRLGVTVRAVQGRAAGLSAKHKSQNRTIEERFHEYTQWDNTSGCILWTGSKTRKGYGILQAGGTQLAHRVAMKLAKIDIPRGMSVCHRCDTPSCVNVDHLFIASHRDNMRDCRAKGRLAGMSPLRKGTPVADTECINGHALTGDNLFILASGARVCRACRNYNARMLRARRKAA